MSKRIVVFTGAGVSAESGLGTFRDSDGLWEHYRIEDVCTHEAWLRNPQLCVDFYNARRKDTLAAQPNAAHFAIAKLQAAIPGTRVITQNIDDLHERAGAWRDHQVALRTQRNRYRASERLGTTLRRPPSGRVVIASVYRVLRRRCSLLRGSMPHCGASRNHGRYRNQSQCVSGSLVDSLCTGAMPDLLCRSRAT